MVTYTTLKFLARFEKNFTSIKEIIEDTFDF